jgi:peptide/nickel transport system substrate-binding protein
MRNLKWLLALPLAGGLAISMAGDAAAGAPKRGGILKFVVPDEPPSFDGHKETTFALIHPIAPFYSLLIRVDPDNPATLTDFRCDLCTDMPAPTDGGKTYTFKIRKGVKFHDGTPLTAKDVHASFERIIFPTNPSYSARKAQFSMVESVSAPDDETVVFKLKYPSGGFIPALATPYNFIYSKAILDEDQRWYEKNVMGSGPFVFESRQAGAMVRGKRNPDYYHPGKPYLDGFEAIFAKTQTLRVQAIRGDQARSSSAASRRRAATISWPRSARTSPCRRAAGTACCSLVFALAADHHRPGALFRCRVHERRVSHAAAPDPATAAIAHGLKRGWARERPPGRAWHHPDNER